MAVALKSSYEQLHTGKPSGRHCDDRTRPHWPKQLWAHQDGRCHERQRCESTSLSDASFHIHHAMCHNRVGSRKGGGEGGMGRKQDKKRSRRGTVGDGRAAGRSGQNSRSRCSNWVHLSSICLTRRKTRAIAFLAAAATVTRTQQQFAPECRARTVREGGKRK